MLYALAVFAPFLVLGFGARLLWAAIKPHPITITELRELARFRQSRTSARGAKVATPPYPPLRRTLRDDLVG